LKAALSKTPSKVGTSPADRERLRGYIGLAWDWLIAKVRAFVRVTDTAISYSYRTFARVTADWLEPYIRVTVVTLAVGLVGWAIYVVNTPPALPAPNKAKPVVVAKRPVYALPPLTIITTVPPEKTAKAGEAKPKKKLYRKKETACSWPFC
jgi:hypothetical protein